MKKTKDFSFNRYFNTVSDPRFVKSPKGRGKIIWYSAKWGTYVLKKHGEIGVNRK